MSILVFAESSEGKYKKVALEVTSYGKKLADQLQTNMVVVTAFVDDVSPLEKHGAEKILNSKSDALKTSDAAVWADLIVAAAKQENADTVIIDSSANGAFVAPLVAAKLEAGFASNVVALPHSTNPFLVKRKAFSNKAFNNTEIKTTTKVLGIAKNAFGIFENPAGAEVLDFNPDLGSPKLTRTSIEQTTGKVTIADADIIVSGGRGLKSGDNWGMVEELAEVLGAATACSKPVSDLGWRPHSEHVGQTGKQAASNLYIAIGISGAIQHLAGVNSSKVKVVINTDPEAPFFKSAEYGIVGDAFEIVPKLVNKLKAFKAENG
jgi:electron transfer flavoprotein alpha subunit